MIVVFHFFVPPSLLLIISIDLFWKPPGNQMDSGEVRDILNVIVLARNLLDFNHFQ